MTEKFVNGKFEIMSEHLAVACLKTHFQHIPEQTEKNIRISSFHGLVILQYYRRKRLRQCCCQATCYVLSSLPITWSVSD